MAHHHSRDGNHSAGGATQIQTVLLQVPEERNSKRRTNDQTGNAQAGSFRQYQSNHLDWAHAYGHQHAEFTSALVYRHQHRVHDTDDGHQEENKKQYDSYAVIELNIVGQFRCELRPCHHTDRESLTQFKLKCGGYVGGCVYVSKLDTDFMDPSGRKVQKVLQ